MKKIKTIKRGNLPTRLPVSLTLITYMGLDTYKAPGWIWGALGIVFLLLWVISIYAICIEKQVDIFE